ncbi:MAG: EamA family transporter [Anaerolineae bacterium]|nr:EamA family transporter [Anaerolineae bacterium]
MTRQLVRGAVCGIVAASIWGGMYVVSDEVLKVIPPFTLLSLRLLLGVLVLGVVLGIQGKLALPLRDVIKLMAVGVLGSGISLGAQFVGTQLSTGMNGAVITSASPAFIVFFAWLILREPLTKVKIAAVVVASIGVLIALDLSKADFSPETFDGNLWLTFAALTWGAYSVLVRRVSANYPSLTITFYGLIGGLFVGIPLGIGELARPDAITGAITPGVVLGVLYLGIVSTSIALFLWNLAFALVEASVASLFFFAQPLVGVLLSVMLGQQLTMQIAMGGALIVIGVLLSMWQPQAKAVSGTSIEAG